MQRLRIVGGMNNCILGYKLIHGFNGITLYSTASLTSSSEFPPNYCFNDYLVCSLGFSHQQAVSISTKLSKRRKNVDDFNFRANAISVVNLFEKHGFDDTLIRKLVKFNPRVLSYNVESILIPKFRFLQEQGFSGLDIIHVISRNPHILSSGLESIISPAIHILRQVMGTTEAYDKCVRKTVINCRRHFCVIPKFLLPNIDLLISYGIPIEVIRKRIIRQPGPYLQKTKSFKNIIMKVENELGISRDSRVFLHGVELLCNFNKETLELKCHLFKSYGWTQSDVETFILKNAASFTFSEAFIKKRLDFLMNELHYKPAQLTSCVNLLTCSFEKTIMPRHNVLLILKEKGLLKTNYSLGSAVKLSESRFLMKFVIPFKEVHEVYAKHMDCSLKMLTPQSAVSIS